MKKHLPQLLSSLFLLIAIQSFSQTFGGKVTTTQNEGLSNATVFVLETKQTTTTDASGNWLIDAGTTGAKTLVFHAEGYTYEQLVQQKPATDLTVVLRESIPSAASLREDNYILDGCASVSIPDNSKWNVQFEISELEGDLAPDQNYTRRDPSSVIKVGDKYYVWYSYSLTFDNQKLAPWDRNDIYYATSTDGWEWHEQGPAIQRGTPGSFDAQSVFTTEIFVHDNKYYLVYQAAANTDGIYNRNTVGMAFADSPDGPWTKLDKPVLYPTYTDDIFFDNNAVHDPCIVFYNNKFYLYYKGECNCRSNGNCKNWCNPVCGLNKQVKWGVAIADYPTGPYQKSEYNPITNTGHEVMVWPYKDGIAILQHQDGPEARSIQFAEDGVNFIPQGQVVNIPEAAGLFRAEKSDSNPHAGVKWGLGHQLKWNAGPKGWMYIYRFDKISNDPTGLNLVPEKIQLGVGQNRNLTLKLTPFNASSNDLIWNSANNAIATVKGGIVTGVSSGQTSVIVKNIDESLKDTCQIFVQKNTFEVTTITVPANSYKTTGGTWDDKNYGGNGFGVNKTNSGINFVNRNDWCEYDVNLSETGVYELSYQISTPMENTEISMEIANIQVAHDPVFNSGSWDSYYTLNSDAQIVVDKTGIALVKLLATGSDAWQWNLKSFTFKKLHNLSIAVSTQKNSFAKKISVFTVPETNKLYIRGIRNKYMVSLYSLLGQKYYSAQHTGDTNIQFDSSLKGAYLVSISQNNKLYSAKIFL